jgi:hypothetical protein
MTTGCGGTTRGNDLVRITKADGTPKFLTTADLFGLAKENLEVCSCVPVCGAKLVMF